MDHPLKARGHDPAHGRRESTGGSRFARFAASPWAGAFLASLVALAPLVPLLVRAGHCLPWSPGAMSYLTMADTRLNAWILAWDLHALAGAPLDLFRANIFHPWDRALAGSEHMLGVAIQAAAVGGHLLGAVATYNVALALSFALLAATMFAFVMRVVSDPLAAFCAALLAALAAWRFDEVSHLQLLSLQGIPLVWLLVDRISCGDRSLRTAAALAVAAALQLASCFYNAYYLTFSLAVAIAVGPAPPSKAASRLRPLLGLAPAYAIFGLLSLPYLDRAASGDLAAVSFAIPCPLPVVLQGLFSCEGSLLSPISYSPGVVGLLLAAAALPGMLRSTGGSAARRWTAILLACIAGCLLFALGPSDRGWGDPLRMPNRLLMDHVPGFANLRVPMRWLALANLCLAAMAGIGFAALRRGLAATAGRPVPASALHRGLSLAVAAAVLASLARPPVPRTEAFSWPPAAEPAWKALAALERGPTVELPYRGHEGDSHYILGSTRHWQPLLNGYTGYPPPAYEFLLGLAGRLPERTSLAALVSLTGLRWILLHETGDQDRSPWSAAVADGRLRIVHDDGAATIFEVADRRAADSMRSWLTRTDIPATTLPGTDRAPLELGAGSGRIVVDTARPNGRGELEVTLENDTDAPWPASDFRRAGLIALAYRYLPSDGRPPTAYDFVPLWFDVPAHARSRERVTLRWPPGHDRFAGRIEFALAQQREGGPPRMLGLPPASATWLAPEGGGGGPTAPGRPGAARH